MAEKQTLLVNGIKHEIASDPATPLLDVLRGELGLMATRFGCGTETCGTCMVLVDDTPAYACTRLRRLASFVGRSRSRTNSRPPGLTTRAISAKTAAGAGM